MRLPAAQLLPLEPRIYRRKDDKIRNEFGEKIRSDPSERYRSEHGERVRSERGEKYRSEHEDKYRSEHGDKYRFREHGEKFRNPHSSKRDSGEKFRTEHSEKSADRKRKSRSLPRVPRDDEPSPSRHSAHKSAHASAHKPATTLRSLMSRSMHLLQVDREPKEVPVVVDEVTKWIAGVTAHTTCDNIIAAILEKQNTRPKVTILLNSTI